MEEGKALDLLPEFNDLFLQIHTYPRGGLKTSPTALRIYILCHNLNGTQVRSAIPHPRLEVREIVSLGAPEAVGQIRIGFVGGGRAGKYPR